MNTHLSEHIRVLKRMEVKINEDNVNMPEKSMQRINMLLKYNIAQLRGADSTSQNRQQLAKCLGKCNAI